jgi:hypothetical protein
MSMMRDSIGLTLAGVLVILAGLHVVWAVRGVVSDAVVPTTADGVPVLRPGRVASLGVALALCLAAMLVLGRVDLAWSAVPSPVYRVGIWGVAVAFAARAVGDFRYAGLFKREQGTPFARMDTAIYTPLCIAMAVSAVAVALL